MKPRLLLVDDDADILAVFKEQFTRAGFDVVAKDSGATALEHLEANAVDIVLSDVRMPMIDGIELVERVVGTASPPTPVLLMSGYHDLSEAEALDRGAVGVVTKPIDGRKVAAQLHALTRSARERWRATAPAAARPRLELRVSSLDEAAGAGIVAFGRGGVFVRDAGSQHEVGAELELKISAASGPSLAAVVRAAWVRRRESRYFHPGYGLEFVSLAGDSLELALQRAQREGLKAFIPIGSDPNYLRRP